MWRLVLVLMALLVATPVNGAQGKKGSPGAAPSRSEPTAREPDAKLKEAAMRARETFRKRVDLCGSDPRRKCAPDVLSLIETAEKDFVRACRACAPEERCEADRSSVRGGLARRSNPCG